MTGYPRIPTQCFVVISASRVHPYSAQPKKRELTPDGDSTSGLSAKGGVIERGGTSWERVKYLPNMLSLRPDVALRKLATPLRHTDCGLAVHPYKFQPVCLLSFGKGLDGSSLWMVSFICKTMETWTLTNLVKQDVWKNKSLFGNCNFHVSYQIGWRS